MSIQPPNIPSLSSKVDPEVRKAIDAVKSWLAKSTADGGFITKGSLSENLSATSPEVAALFSGIIPPQVQHLEATGAFASIILSWDDPRFAAMAYVGVYRNTLDDLGTAQLIGTTISTLYADTPPNASISVDYYYWVRAVSTAGVEGPFNSTAGTPGSTATDPAYALEILTDRITSSQLHNDLISRIDVSSVPTMGLSLLTELLASMDVLSGEAQLSQVLTQASAIQQTVKEEINRGIAVAQEATDRAHAILDEQTARGIAIAAEATDRNILASQLLGADGTSNTSGLIYNERFTRSSATNSLAQQISLLSAGVEGGFDPYQTYYFDTTAEGWIGSGCIVSQSGGWVEQVSVSSAPALLEKTGLLLQGSKYATVKFRIKRLAGSGWGFSVDYQTATGWVTGKNVTTETVAVGDTATLTVDFSDTTAWTGNTITGIRVKSGITTADRFSFDWIAVGRQAPAVSVAAFQSEQQARAEAELAEAQARESLSTKLVGQADPTGLTINTVSAGLIFDEKSARSENDQSQVERIGFLEATVDNVDTGVAATAREFGLVKLTVDNSTTGVAALGQKIESLDADVNGPDTGAFAKIAVEQQVRADLEKSLTEETSKTISTFGPSGEALLSQIVAGAISGGVTAAAIIEEQKTRATAIEAETLRTDSLLATLADDTGHAITALITAEQQARATAIQAEATQRQALAVLIADAQAIIVAEQRAVATKTNAEAYQRGLLAATVGGHSTAIAIEQQVRTSTVAPDYSPTGSYAAKKCVIHSGQLYRNTSGVTITNAGAWTGTGWTAITADLYASYGVKLDVDGKVAGFGMDNDGTLSKMIVSVDEFAVARPVQFTGAAAPVGMVEGNEWAKPDGSVWRYGTTGLVVDGTGQDILTTGLALDWHRQAGHAVPIAVLTSRMEITPGVWLDPGVYIDGASINNLSVKRAAIALLAVDSAQIADAAIVTEKIAKLAVTSELVADTIGSGYVNGSGVWVPTYVAGPAASGGFGWEIDSVTGTIKGVGLVVEDATITTAKLGANQITVPRTKSYAGNNVSHTGVDAIPMTTDTFNVTADAIGQPIYVSCSMSWRDGYYSTDNFGYGNAIIHISGTAFGSAHYETAFPFYVNDNVPVGQVGGVSVGLSAEVTAAGTVIVETSCEIPAGMTITIGRASVFSILAMR